MKALSLFSGIGGLDLAAEMAGIETAAFCEIEPFAVKVLERRWAGVPIFNDVRTLTARGLESKGLMPIDVVHGGFPCQDVSTSGKRTGFVNSDGQLTRSGLWGEMCRIVGEVKPRWVVAENVWGLLSIPSPDGRTPGGGMELFSETWPKWGIVQDGHAMALPMLEQSIPEIESRLWPTPLASDGAAWIKCNKKDFLYSVYKTVAGGHSIKAIYPLILKGFSINQSAEFYETMMGFPKGWTDLNLSETQLSHSSFIQYSKQSQK